MIATSSVVESIMQSRATKVRSGQPTKGSQYTQHARNLAQMQAEQRNQRMNAQFQNARKVMRGNMPKGVLQNGLKRAILENNRLNGNSMANMGRTNKSNMTRARMQRDGSQMDMNGQRAPSPNSNEIAPGAFPNKRPRVEGAMNNNMSHARAREHAHQVAIAQRKSREEHIQEPLTSSEAAFLHALALGENKMQLPIAREKQDSMSGPDQHGLGQFRRAVSFLGARPGLSPNPADTKGRIQKLGHHELPGSPMPDSVMQQQRDLSAPKSTLPDPEFSPVSALPIYQQLPPDMKLPPISYPSHPIANFGGQQPTPQQVKAMRNGQKNGQSHIGIQPPKGPQFLTTNGILAPASPVQRRKNPTPPVPSSQEIPPHNHAPPTPNQTSEAAPRKKSTKGKKKPSESNEGNTGVTKRRIEPTISRDYSSRDNKRLRSRFMALQKRHGV